MQKGKTHEPSFYLKVKQGTPFQQGLFYKILADGFNYLGWMWVRALLNHISDELVRKTAIYSCYLLMAQVSNKLVNVIQKLSFISDK